MKKEILLAAGIDYDAALTRYTGDEVLFERILRGFAGDPKLEEALSLYRSHNYQLLIDCVMEIASVSNTLGMADIHRSASQVLRYLHEKNTAPLGPAMQALEQSYRKTLAALKEALN